MTKFGKVYLVGGGPGDPGLISLRAIECLKLADLVLYDGLVNPHLLRYAHADTARTCRIAGPGGRRLDQDEINQQLIDAAKEGLTVVRLKGGDPLIFGRGLEEARALGAEGIEYEVVPGITAATGAGAYTGIALTHRERASAVAFVTGHEDPTKDSTALDYAALATFPGTLVFYMGLHQLGRITGSLAEHGKSIETPVAVVSKATTPMQRVVTGRLDNIVELVREARLKAPSLIIVGDCVDVRERASWFEMRPLMGLTIGVPRAESQSATTAEQIFALGGQPVLMPTIETRSLAESDAVQKVIQDVSSYDWIVFTSRNGVDSFCGAIWDAGLDGRTFGAARIASIGPATRDALVEYRMQSDLTPETYRAEGLADALAPHVNGKRVLWVRASRGREVLPERLRSAGAEFHEVIAYEHVDLENLPEAVTEQLRAGSVDWIALSSPAIARNIQKMIAALGVPESELPRFAAISPVTAEAAHACGLNVQAVATEHTWPGLLQAIVDQVTAGNAKANAHSDGNEHE